MNLTLAIAVYATICKALGRLSTFLGSPELYGTLPMYGCRPSVQGRRWMATDPNCANQAFNITNSDLFAGRTYAQVRQFLRKEVGPPRHMSLARPWRQGSDMDRIVEKNGLLNSF